MTDIALHLRARPLLATLEVYKNISRLLFLSGEPTPYVLASNANEGLVGIPQGCPRAPFFCNLLGHAWITHMLRKVEHAKCFSYLDDRLLMAHSWQELDDALEATVEFDKPTGPKLNHTKCAYTQVSSRRSSSPPRPTLSCKHPVIQRDALVSDPVAALYLDGGRIYNQGQLTAAISKAAARASNGTRFSNSHCIRNRDAMHLAGIGIHRTCPISAAIICFVRQLWALKATKGVSDEEWDHLFEKKKFCAAGLPRFIEGALAAAGITWRASSTLEADEKSFHILDNTLEFSANTWEDAAASIRTPPFRKKLQELCAFLRLAHNRRLARQRPMEFEDLKHSMNEDPMIRETMYIAWHHPGGRSLITRGRLGEIYDGKHHQKRQSNLPETQIRG